MSESRGGAPTSRRSFDPGAPLLLLFTLALNFPYLDSRVLPLHDTFYNFVNFHTFYSHFFFEHDLVHWYPYGAFGLPAALQQMISFTPIDYLVGVVGALLRVTDAMLLFKVASIGEQIVFVLGVFLLSRRLFWSRATALVLGVAAAGTVVWVIQQWFDLRFFYMLPLVLYCVASFLEFRRAEWLWAAAIASVAWTMGNVPYFVPIWGLVLLISVAPAALRYSGEWSGLFRRSAPNLLLLAIFATAAAVVVYVSFRALDFVVMYEPGRDPITLEVDLETFRSWGGNADLLVVARSFLFGWPLHLPWGSGADNSAYVGLLTLFGVGIAIARERSRLFLGVAAAIVALVWLSLGGIFATVVYYLPGLSEYRHVGLVYGLVKTLGIIAAGYGIERLWRWKLRLPSRAVLGWVAAVLAIASLAVVPAAWEHHVVLRLWLYLVLAVASLALTRSLAGGLVVALALDLAIYQAAVFRSLPKLLADYETALGATRVHEIAYQPRRYASLREAPPGPATARAKRALGLAERPGSMEVYWTTYEFAQFDPCRSAYWTDIYLSGVDLLLRMERNRKLELGEVLGCDAPKLRLARSPTIVDGQSEAREAWIAAPPIPGAVRDVIQLAPGTPRPASGTPYREAGAVQVTHFTLNEVVAQTHVTTPDGAWLVYADAFHTGWRATVDGRDAPVSVANLGFKAVRVPAGDSVVRLYFQPGASYYASYALAAFGFASGVALLALAGFASAPRVALRSARLEGAAHA